MKKPLLSLASLLMVFGVYAQNQQLLNTSAKRAYHNVPNEKVSGNEVSDITLPEPITAAVNPSERIIGNTTYDLQTNTSVMNRIMNYGNDNVVAIWTHSNATVSTYLDRGTGYAQWDGTTWDDNPFERVESKRVGWGNLVTTGSGKEFIITHNTDAQVEDLQFTSRSTVGSGTWNEDVSTLQSPSPDGNWWPRATSGGADGNSLHVLSLTYPVANDGSEYLGQDGAITYSRSTDEGQTWDSVHVILAGMDSSRYIGFSADDYNWANSVGDTIAFVVGGTFQDLFLMKSEDNGGTWTKTVIQQFPKPFFDIDTTLILDTLFSNDGSVDVTLDSEGKAHVLYGSFFANNDDLTDGGTYGYFPNLSALMYWNEDMGALAEGDSIAGMEDIDGDGIGAVAVGSVASGYNPALVGMPSVGIDENDNMFVSFSAAREDLSDGTNNYRHVYLMKSEDGGASWTTPVDLNYEVDDEFRESVFASVADYVDDNIHIVYQRDFEPGLAVRPDPGTHSITTNEIVYTRIPVDLSVGMAEEHILHSDVNLYPNPASDQVTLTFATTERANAAVRIHNAMGQLVQSFSNTTMLGGNQVAIDMSSLSKGLYFINLEVGERMISRKIILE